jgi:cytochrome c oxidase subunit 2
MVVNVTARQWSWLFQYEKGISEKELRVPVGKPVKLILKSQDVIHGFYAPAFRIKQDAVPGMETYLWFQPTEVGTFDVMCSQYCGLEHAHMLSKIIVLPQEEFKNWYEAKKQEAALKKAPPGAELYEEKGCAGCHSTSAGKKETIVVDEAFIQKFISEPNVVNIEGYPPIMPKITMTDEELKALVDYIKSLK